MKLIAGLGNPGTKYADTRHNIGYLIVEKLALQLNANPWRARFHGVYAAVKASDEKLLLLKPETFMNNSGQAIQAAASYFQISNENIIVIHDDKDLDFGTMKIKLGGSDGGHKGIRSTIQHLGNADFVRIRIGVGKPRYGEETADFVLRGFYPEEAANLDEWVEIGAQAIQTVLDQGYITAANKYNRKRCFEIKNES